MSKAKKRKRERGTVEAPESVKAGRRFGKTRLFLEALGIDADEHLLALVEKGFSPDRSAILHVPPRHAHALAQEAIKLWLNQH